MDGMAIAACPVLGHGSETDCVGTDTVGCTTGVTTGGESGVVEPDPDVHRRRGEQHEQRGEQHQTAP